MVGQPGADCAKSGEKSSSSSEEEEREFCRYNSFSFLYFFFSLKNEGLCAPFGRNQRLL